ncbi:hypothetical protein XAC2852_810091 [Xanthomonas citri pv. citri]|nr:hypothetical protein XAC2852_810091 [Xanthomonas citri pv. citri]
MRCMATRDRERMENPKIAAPESSHRPNQRKRESPSPRTIPHSPSPLLQIIQRHLQQRAQAHIQRRLVQQELRRMVAGCGGRVDTLGGGADEEEHRRNLLGVEREIFSAHLQRRFVHIVGTHHGLQAWQHPGRQCGVVDGGRIARLIRHLCLDLGPMRGGGVFGHVLEIGKDLLAHALVEGADGADHFHIVGDDVVADAALDRAEAEHRRLLGQVGAAADHRLRGADHVGAGHDRVDAVPRRRAMGLAADHLDREAVRGRHQRAAAHRDLAGLHAGEHMQAEHRLRGEVGKQAFLEHQRGAALFVAWGAFFGGLEDQHHFAGQLLAHAHQRFGHAEQDGGVRIVAAGMHHPDLLAAVFGSGLGSERQPGLLCHRQRVHVRTQRDLRPRLGALDDGHHAVMGDAGARLEAQLAQLRGHGGGRALLAVGQLRVLVEVAAPLHHLGLQRGGSGLNVGPLRSLRGGEHGQGEQQRAGQQAGGAHRQSSKDGCLM